MVALVANINYEDYVIPMTTAFAWRVKMPSWDTCTGYMSYVPRLLGSISLGALCLPKTTPMLCCRWLCYFYVSKPLFRPCSRVTKRSQACPELLPVPTLSHSYMTMELPNT
jgi:hypothetical protein